MIEIAFSSSFKRAFKKKIAGKKERENNFWRKIELFKDDPFDPQLKLTNFPANSKIYGVLLLSMICA